MGLSFYEESKRVYSNSVSITYEKINDEDLYIHSVISTLKRDGRGTVALKQFLNEFKVYNIYILSSSELGTSNEILDKWYEKLGFEKVVNSSSIPYNITHCKYSK